MVPPQIVRQLLRDFPTRWFRDANIDDRDRALLDAEDVPWLDMGQQSFLCKIDHKMKQDRSHQATPWTVENDDFCKNIVSSNGALLHGFTPIAGPAPAWQFVSVKVQVTGAPLKTTFDWGFLATSPCQIRIFKGPSESYSGWDAMILRDCVENTLNLHKVEEVGRRLWDVLAVKMNKEYDFPWRLVAVRATAINEKWKKGHRADCYCPPILRYQF